MHYTVALLSWMKFSNYESFCMRIIMNYWIKQSSFSTLFSQYICLKQLLLERILPPCVLFCLCVCSLLGSQDRFLSARQCSPALPPAAGDRSALHPNPPTPTNQQAPTSRIPSHPWLYQPDQQKAACFLHFSHVSDVHKPNNCMHRYNMSQEDNFDFFRLILNYCYFVCHHLSQRNKCFR